MAFTKKQGEELVALARKVLENHLSGSNKFSIGKYDDAFNSKGGVFVTLYSYPDKDLRGCIGYPEPAFKLIEALVSSATSAAHDSRFQPVRLEELEEMTIEITVLTEPKRITGKPSEYKNKIKIGEDGLIVKRAGHSGLLLPQVPIEQEPVWDAEQFLNETCWKASLEPTAWMDTKTEVYKFQGQLFLEEEPKGKVVEKKLKAC